MLFSVQIVFGLVNSFRFTPTAELYVAQYSNIVYLALLATVCTFILTGVIVGGKSLVYRVVMIGIVVGGLVGGTFLPYLQNPRFLYTTPDVTDFRMVDRAKGLMREEGIGEPTSGEIAERIVLSDWNGLNRTGELSGQREMDRISELLPYTEGDEYIALVNRPFFESYAFTAFACVFILGIFFLLNFFLDPPRAPHLEKIHYGLLVYSVLEGVHATAMSNAMTFQELATLERVGKYATAAVIAVFIGLFVWRLKFLTRGEGDFYEGRLERDPGSVSRWRDGIDEFVIHQFLSKEHLSRRFLVRRTRDIN